MGFDAGLLGGLKAPASATVPVTNLSNETSGGQSTITGPAIDSEEERFILYGTVATIILAILGLWALGAFAFRGLPQI